MITKQVMERVVATKLREKHFLTFLKYCGEFYKEEAFINEKDFVLDVARKEKDGTITELGDSKLQSTIFLDFKTEDVENQQKYFLLSYDQLIRYKKRIEKEQDDYLLYLVHIFTNKQCHFLNKKLNDISIKMRKDRYDERHYLKKVISILKVSMQRLCKFLKEEQCKTIKLPEQIQHKFQNTMATGKILKIDSTKIGTYMDLTRHWDQLQPVFQSKILGAR